MSYFCWYLWPRSRFENVIWELREHRNSQPLWDDFFLWFPSTSIKIFYLRKPSSWESKKVDWVVAVDFSDFLFCIFRILCTSFSFIFQEFWDKNQNVVISQHLLTHSRPEGFNFWTNLQCFWVFKVWDTVLLFFYIKGVRDSISILVLWFTIKYKEKEARGEEKEIWVKSISFEAIFWTFWRMRS